MNRDGRARLRNSTRAYVGIVRQAVYTYTGILEDMLNDEQDKYDRLPEQIQSSSKGEQLSEAIEMIEELLSDVKNMDDALDDIPTKADVTVSFSPYMEKEVLMGEKRDLSFHALIPSSLMRRLKEESEKTGLSMNEITCRALVGELEKNMKNYQKMSKSSWT